MNSSYFAVPGRGGASGGKPPAHCGMYSPIPSASFALMLAHPLRAKPAIKIATIVEIWRGRGGDRKRVQFLSFKMMDLGDAPRSRVFRPHPPPAPPAPS